MIIKPQGCPRLVSTIQTIKVSTTPSGKIPMAKLSPFFLPHASQAGYTIDRRIKCLLSFTFQAVVRQELLSTAAAIFVISPPNDRWLMEELALTLCSAPLLSLARLLLVSVE